MKELKLIAGIFAFTITFMATVAGIAHLCGVAKWQRPPQKCCQCECIKPEIPKEIPQPKVIKAPKIPTIQDYRRYN